MKMALTRWSATFWPKCRVQDEFKGGVPINVVNWGLNTQIKTSDGHIDTHTAKVFNRMQSDTR